jgi:membrane-associated phospholipid phosphatase
MRRLLPFRHEFHRREHLPSSGFVLAAVLVVLFIGKTGLKAAADFASEPLNTAFLSLGIGMLIWQAWRDRWRQDALRVVAVMLTETALYGAIKIVTWNGFHILPRPSGHAGGFPSGHTAAACALAYLLTERYPRLGPVWYLFAAVIGWSRLDAGAHYGYQIAAGALLGLTVAQLVSPRFPRSPA